MIFREKSLHVGDRQKCSNHLLLFAKTRNVHRLMYESQMDAGFITADGGVERRLAVEEVMTMAPPVPCWRIRRAAAWAEKR